MLILYDFDLSANCYAVRLLASILGVETELRRIDVYPGREDEGEAFRRLNPLGPPPVLQTDTHVLRDWQAILAYVAINHDPEGRWWQARDPGLMEWLGFARGLEASAGRARLHLGMGVAADLALCQKQAHQHLRVLERHLWFSERSGRFWLLPYDHPTVADLAIFVHVILCEEGGIERMDYPAVRRWTDRIRDLPGFVAVSGVFLPLQAAAR